MSISCFDWIIENARSVCFYAHLAPKTASHFSECALSFGLAFQASLSGPHVNVLKLQTSARERERSLALV